MDYSPAPQKRRLGVFAWLGIGCGALIAILIIGVAVVTLLFGPQIKNYFEDVQKNPKTLATSMIKVSAGGLEMAAEDDVNKRYTVRQKATGKLTTIYWDAKQGRTMVVEGDFSAIPADATAPPATPEPK
jgi:hypothetical protein